MGMHTNKYTQFIQSKSNSKQGMRGPNHSKAISYIIVAIIITICINLIWTMTPNANAAGEPIRLGFPFWAPNFFSYLAQEKGFFE